MNHVWCTVLPGGVRLALLIAPNARKTEVVGGQGDALKLKLQAQPVEGQANAALIKYLAQALAVPRGAVTITHGLTGRRKLVEIAAPGLSLAAVESLVPTPHRIR